MMNNFSLIITGCCLFFISACATDKPQPMDARKLLEIYGPQALCVSLHVGDPEEGEKLFNKQVLRSKAGCITCHSITKNKHYVGPSLYGIADNANERVEGVIAANYIYTAIIAPDYHLAEGYATSSMPSYQDALTLQEIDDLVGYLLTLKKERDE